MLSLLVSQIVGPPQLSVLTVIDIISSIIDIINRLIQKFSLTDTVEIVHKMENIGKKELYKKALSIKNEK